MFYYLAQKGSEENFYGVPLPAVGIRVVFDIERLFAARERGLGRPVDRKVAGDEGLVVHEDPMAVLTLPDRLWRVDDLSGAIRLHPANPWLRCQSLTVVEEVPAWLVMGPHGDLLAQVIDQARALTDEQAHAMAAMDSAEEQRLVRAVWDRWLRQHRSGSPVGCGLYAVHRAVTETARRTGAHLFGWDDEDEVEVLTDESWRQASAAANAAALALGAPEILGAEENRKMALRWTSQVSPLGSRS